MIIRSQRHKISNLIDIFSVKNKNFVLLSNEARDFTPPPSKDLLSGREVPLNNANNFNEDNINKFNESNGSIGVNINRINLLNQYPDININFELAIE